MAVNEAVVREVQALHILASDIQMHRLSIVRQSK